MYKEFIMKQACTSFCHAPTLAALPNGELLCCWFGGSREGERDAAIYASRHGADGWSEPIKLADGAEANWNPVLFVRGDGTLQLFYKQGQQIAFWRTLTSLSADNGHTWTEPRELAAGDTSGGRGPVRNKPLRLADGRILAGASTERGLWQAFADVSDDDGVTWRKSSLVRIKDLQYTQGEKTADSDIAVSEQSFYGRGVIQPSHWQSDDGGVHMLLRSSEGFIYRSDSSDGGLTWCGAYATALPNNNSGLDAVRTQRGALFLVCNPVSANWGLRSPLSLFRSDDDGGSWRKLLDLETEAAEFSYPAIIAQEDELHITYTWKRINIAYLRLNSVNL